MNVRQKNTKHLKKHKDSKYKGVQSARLHIRGSTNNAILTITTEKGDTIWQTSCCRDGLKNSRKSTPFAFQMALSRAINKTSELGINTLGIVIKTSGISNVRDNLLEINNSGLRIPFICDKTSTPHNGVRPPVAPKK